MKSSVVIRLLSPIRVDCHSDDGQGMRYPLEKRSGITICRFLCPRAVSFGVAEGSSLGLKFECLRMPAAMSGVSVRDGREELR